MYLDCSPVVLAVPVKICSKCGEVKPATTEHFYMRDGHLSTRCHECRSAYNKEYRSANREHLKAMEKAWRGANHERLAALQKTWCSANREHLNAKKREYYNSHKDRHAEHVSAWKNANKRRVAEYTSAWQKANKERIIENKKAWRRANPDKDKTTAHRRRARNRSLPDTLTPTDWQIALDYFGNSCAACGQQLNGLFHSDHMDHWIPLKSPDCPGTVPSNMVPLCSTCNLSKQDRPADEWLVWKFGPRKGRAILRKIEAFLESRKQGAA